MATEASLRLGIDARPARDGARDFERSTDRVKRASGDAEKRVGGLSDSFRKLRSTVTIAATAIAAASAFMGRSMIRAASDAEELEGKFRVVFKGVEEDAQSAASAMATEFRRSIIDVKEAMAGFQDTFVPMGLARDDALKLSDALARLSFDLSSFYNKEQADVIRDIQSALVGQTETMRKYGTVILEANVKQEALRLGLVGVDEELTEQQKLLARLSLIYQGTADAQGDLVRTQDSFANRVRELQGYIKDLRVEFGQRLIVAIDATIEKMGGIGKVQDVIRAGFIGVTNVAREAIETIGVFIAKISDAIGSLGGMREIERLAYTIADAIGAIFQALFETLGELAISASELFRGLPAIMRSAFREGGVELQRIFEDIFPWMDPPRTRENLKQWLGDAKQNILDMYRDVDAEAADILSGLSGEAFADTAEALSSEWSGPLRNQILAVANEYRGLIDEVARIQADDLDADQAIKAFAGFDPARVIERVEQIKAKLAEIPNKPNYVGPLFPAELPQSQFNAYPDFVPYPARTGGTGLDFKALSSGGGSSAGGGPYNMPEVPPWLTGEDYSGSELPKIDDSWKSIKSSVDGVVVGLTEADRLNQRFSDAAGRTVAMGFEEAIFSGNKLRDVVKGLAEDLARLVFRRYVGSQIISAFGGVNADGNVYSNGNVVAFAGGGVVNGPTFFPMSYNRTGLMGEAGPEAIMPLERGADGKLGVKASAGGNTNVNVHVYGVRDADSFKRSERQIVNSLQSRMARR